jgi:hypothetical protein
MINNKINIRRAFIILIKTWVSVIFELIPIVILLILIVLWHNKFHNNTMLLLFLCAITMVTVIYLLTANIFFPSLSAILLKYRFQTHNIRILRILSHNIIFYLMYFLPLFFAYKGIYKSFRDFMNMLVILDILGTCVPYVGTRFSLWIFGIEVHNIKSEKK